MIPNARKRRHAGTGDAKGHWPAGKRRHSPRGWPLLLIRMRELAAERLSLREIGRRVGVSDRTVRRWLDETDLPSPDHAEQIRALLRRA